MEGPGLTVAEACLTQHTPSVQRARVSGWALSAHARPHLPPLVRVFMLTHGRGGGWGLQARPRPRLHVQRVLRA